jgi:hypothetical protein
MLHGTLQGWKCFKRNTMGDTSDILMVWRRTTSFTSVGFVEVFFVFLVRLALGFTRILVTVAEISKSGLDWGFFYFLRSKMFV